MADKLVDFAEALSKDAELSKRFKADPQGAMADFGLNKSDQKLVLSGNTEAIQKRLDDAGSAGLIIHSPS